MREIKFRAWVLKDDEHDIVDYMERDINAWQSPLNEYEQGNIVLMQYTGLKDKNGKEIYEGDVIKEGDIITEIVFKDLAWKEKLIYSPHNHLNSYFPLSQNTTRTSLFGEVIGNIFENPELLEGE